MNSSLWDVINEQEWNALLEKAKAGNTVRIKDLDKLNLVKLVYGGKVSDFPSYLKK